MYIYIKKMTKVISISDEAYDELSRLKNGFSFTEIILELTKEKKKKSLMEFAGMLSEEEGNRMLKKIKEERKIGSRRFK
jgi:predicted CopG family antitoxin